MPDYYRILGIPQNASADEIKRAYHEMAKKFHPDVYSGSDGDTRFKMLNEAYLILIHPQKRRQYDFKLRYGGVIEFRRKSEDEVMRRREAMRKEYLRRRRMEAEENERRNIQNFKWLNSFFFWIMAAVITAGLIFSIIDAYLNYDFMMLVFILGFIALLIVIYFLRIRRKKD